MDLETKRLHNKAERIGREIRNIRASCSDEVPPPPSLAKVKNLLLEKEVKLTQDHSHHVPAVSLLWMFFKPVPLASMALLTVFVLGALPWIQKYDLNRKHNKHLASQRNHSSSVRQRNRVIPIRRAVLLQGTQHVNVDEYVQDWERTALQVVSWPDSKQLEEEAVALGKSASRMERDRLAMYQEDDGFQTELSIAPISQKLPPSLQSLEGLADDLSPSLNDLSLMSI